MSGADKNIEISVLVVSPDEIVQHSVGALLENGNSGFLVTTASSVTEARGIANFTFDVVLYVQTTGSAPVASALAEDKEILSSSKFCALLSRWSGRDISSLFKNDLSGAIHVSCSAEQLFAAVRLVSMGGIALQPGIQTSDSWVYEALTESPIFEDTTTNLSFQSEHTHEENVIDLLSARQQQVLSLLVAGRNNREISESLLISTNTVKTHIASIYRILGVNTRVAAVKMAIQNTQH